VCVFVCVCVCISQSVQMVVSHHFNSKTRSTVSDLMANIVVSNVIVRIIFVRVLDFYDAHDM